MGNEEYLVQGNQVEVVDGHTTLPENICGMDQLGCTTHDVTYIWTKPNDLCEFESIRSIEVTKEAGYLVDRENKIILKKGALVSAGANCPAGMIQHTNYHQLYLAYPGVKFPQQRTRLMSPRILMDATTTCCLRQRIR